MNKLESVQKILIELQEKTEKRMAYSKSTEEPDNLPSPVAWAREKAYCWLHATDWYMPQMRQFKIEKMPLRKNLLEYCKQDTLLMVQLHDWLLKKMTKE